MGVGPRDRELSIPILPKPLSAQGCSLGGTHSLTGHLVMSSGQMWAPLEAGSSQVLEAEIGLGKMRGWGTSACHTRPPASQQAQDAEAA